MKGKAMKTFKIKTIPGGICAARGFKANGIHCGIRKNKSKSDSRFNRF